MRYIGPPPPTKFAVATVLDRYSLGDAAIAVAASHGDRWVRWFDTNGRLDDPNKLLAEADRQLGNINIYSLIEVIRRHGPDVHFMVGIEQPARLGPLALTCEQLHGLHAELEGQPGGKPHCTILVTSDDARQLLFPALRAAVGRFELPPAVDSTPTQWAAEVLATPLADKKWNFADETSWVQAIDRLDESSAKKMVGAGLHQPVAGRLRSVHEMLAKRFVSRRHAIEMMIACALARVNVVFLGPPGTAKSLLVRSFSEALGIRRRSVPMREESRMLRALRSGKVDDDNSPDSVAGRRLFEYLLNRYTTPEEIFGGADIDLLLNAGVHFRRTAGMLPCAEVAFLDEIFKANSAILNALLSITNERIFYNMGMAFKVDLAFVVGASNETPDDAELGALYDRFPIRIPCFAVREEHAVSVMEKAHLFDQAATFGNTTHAIPRIACLNDVRLLGKLLQGGLGPGGGGDKVFGDASPDFAADFHTLMRTARREFGVSDRTVALIARLCRALALLDGSTQLEPKHLRAWGYVGAKLDSMMGLQRWVADFIHERDRTAVSLFDEV